MVLTENSHANLQKEYYSISYSIEFIRPTPSKLISIIFNYLLHKKKKKSSISLYISLRKNTFYILPGSYVFHLYGPEAEVSIALLGL